MKKFMVLCLCFVLVASLGVLPTSADSSLHQTFAALVNFEDYKCSQVQPNGFSAVVIQNEMMEDYAFDLSIEWWGENAPSYVEAKKADFESYANARYDISAATWESIRSETVAYYDYKTDTHTTVPFYNADKQVYIIAAPGGYGGAISETRYIGYVKSGNFYHAYLQLITVQETKPTTGIEGKDWTAEEIMGDLFYLIPTQNYHKYVVTYQNGIMKKYKSTAETSVPADLIKVGTPTTTTSTQTTTSASAAATTTTTTTTVGSTSTTTTQPLVTLVENETVKLESVADVFPKDTVVSVEKITETAKIETVQEAVKETVKSFVAYEITATSNNVTVQPNGKIKATFSIPAEYNKENVAVFYVASNGDMEAVPCSIDAGSNTIVAELSHFSTYIVAEKLVADTAAPVTSDGENGSPVLWIVLVIVIVVLLAGVAVWYFAFYRKK